MAWTETTRAQYRRDGLRYTSDLTDAEWTVLSPCVPRSRLGRPPLHDRRSILNAVFHVLSCGCQWRDLPKDCPPRSTVQSYFYRWRNDGTWAWINAELVSGVRCRQGRAAKPTCGIIDSQSVATTESGGPRGRDPNKKIDGRKRHVVTDTDGSVLAVLVHPASVQDCHGAVPLLGALRYSFPDLRHVFADRVYRGKQLLGAIEPWGPWTIEIVQRPTGIKRFQLLPRRWVVERTFAWFGRCRRLAKDFEATIASATAWIFLASIRITIRKIARH